MLEASFYRQDELEGITGPKDVCRDINYFLVEIERGRGRREREREGESER